MQVASLQLLIEDFSSCYRPGFLPFFEAVANRLASPATISSSTSLSHSLSERKGELHVLSYSGETGVEEQKRKERKKEQEEGGKERGQKNSGLSVSGRRNLDRGRQEEGDELTPLRACFFFNSYARTHCRHQDFFHRLANVLEKALEPLYYKAEQEKKRKREPTGEEGKKDINATIESSHHPLSIENRQKPVKPTTSMIRKDTRSEEEEEKGTTEGETTGQRLSSASCVSSSFSSSASSSLLKSSSSSTPELSHNDDGVVVPEGLTFGVLAVGLRGMVNCGYLPSDRLFTYASELLQQYVENPSASILYVRGEGLSVKHLFWALAFFCKARPPLSYSLSPSSPVQTTKPNIPSHLVFPVSSPYLLRTSSFLLRTLPQEAFKAADLNDLATAVRSFHDVLLSLLNNDVKRLNLILKKRKSTLKELERRGKEGGKGRRLREQLAAMSDDTPTMKGRGVAKSTAAHSSNNLEGERSLLRDGSSTSSCPSALFSSSQLDQDGKSSDLIKQIYLSEESTSILIDYLDSYLRLQDLLFTLLRRHLFGLHVSQRIYILEDISALSDVWPAHARRPSKSPELLLALQVGQRGTVSSSSLAPHTEKNNSSSDSVERETRKENRGEVFSEIPMNSATEVVDLAQPSTRSSVSSLPERQDIVVPSPSLRNQVKEEASSSSSQPMLLPTTSHLHILSKEESDQREELVPEQVELPPVVVALLQSIYYRLPPLCLRTLCRLLSALHTLGFTYEGRDTPTRTRFHCSPHRKDLTWSNPLLHVIGREGMRKASPATSEEMAEFLLRYYVDLECFDVCIEPLTFYIEKFACLHASRPLSPPVLEALGVVLQTVMRDHRYAVECLEDLPDFTRSFIRQICPSYRPETMNSARMDEHQQSVFKSKSSLVVAYENREFFFPTSSRRLSSPLLSR
ncbi:hypothetical protein CSUI_006948 [Cystoisospora suis]|uniref:Uncharacterized protein n=1 Tax=Cystoisospora suis TaxID=483139 RepID=A0A2C6KSN3_9APIC|nr:hypothetical protein CSUI_006948 [Cystoisospora suis]